MTSKFWENRAQRMAAARENAIVPVVDPAPDVVVNATHSEAEIVAPTPEVHEDTALIEFERHEG